MTGRIGPAAAAGLSVLTAALVGCSGSHPRDSAGAKSVSSANPMEDIIRYEFAIYYPGQPTRDPAKTLREAAKADYASLTVSAQPLRDPVGLCVAWRIEQNVAKNYAPLPVDSLKYFGRGLTSQQARDLQKSKSALILDFEYSKEHVFDGLRMANGLACKLARQTGGLLWDEETREVFTPSAWEDKRIKTWTEEVPAVPDHVTNHTYQEGDHVRTITLGMAKFGLPDIVVPKFSWADSEHMGAVMFLFAQAIAEGANLRDDGKFDLDLSSLRNKAVATALASGGTGKVLLTWKKGRRSQGDPDNKLLELGFERYPGKSVYEQENSMRSAVFGSSEGGRTEVTRSAEIEEASQRAKQLLPAVRKRYQKGLSPGEFVEVKAPFTVPEAGIEWMWIEVQKWDGSEITGLLRNEPFQIPSLHVGQIVKVNQEDVFDYIIWHADGTREGGQTEKYLEKQSSGGPKK